MDNAAVFPLLAIARLRMTTDGAGVTTLVAARGCPLRCKYCINRDCWKPGTKPPLTPQELYEQVKVDDLYFRATGGGVTFGGGEPLLYADFLPEFRNLCGDAWKLHAETCLNVPTESVQLAASCIDTFIVDIKDISPTIYRAYTGMDNALVLRNLEWLVNAIGPERIRVRVPQIPHFNTEKDNEHSIQTLREMGFTNIECFPYVLRKDML